MRHIHKNVQIIFYCLLACTIGCTNAKTSGFQKQDIATDIIKNEPTVHDDWRETKRTNVGVSYEEFIKKYPNSIYESEARRSIEELRWQDVRSLDTIDAYQNYLQNYPKSKFTFQAKLRLTALQDDLSKWEMAQKKNTIKSYADFLKEYPNSSYSDKAKAKIVDLEVSDIMQKPHGSLPPPEKISIEERRSYSVVNIFNDTKYTITIRYSGPHSFKLDLSPGEKNSVQVVNGKYRVTASAKASNIRNYAGEELLDGSNYVSKYYIKTIASNENSYQPDINIKPVESWPIRGTIPEFQPDSNTKPTNQMPIRRTIPKNLE